MTSVYARILLKYENTRIGEKIQCHASCGLDVRVTNTIQLQSKQEWLRFVHFSSAYNYHVSSVCFQNFLQAFKVLVLLLLAQDLRSGRILL